MRRAPLRFIDSHAHLHSVLERMKESNKDASKAPLLSDIDNLVKKQSEDGFNLEAVVNVFCETEELVVDHPSHAILSHQFPFPVFCSFGQHPHEARKWNDEVENGLRAALCHPKVVALGECGLDYHYMTSPKEDQLRAFRRQCQLAVELNFPLIVHSREAEEDTISILKAEMPTDWHIHLHCFTSSNDMAKQLLGHFPNLFIGFTGVITFKKADEVQSVVKDVPLDRLLLETDSPFMAPTPHRGKTCHSGLAFHTAKKICELKQVPFEVGFEQIRQNTIKMYKLKL